MTIDGKVAIIFILILLAFLAIVGAVELHDYLSTGAVDSCVLIIGVL